MDWMVFESKVPGVPMSKTGLLAYFSQRVGEAGTICAQDSSTSSPGAIKSRVGAIRRKTARVDACTFELFATVFTMTSHELNWMLLSFAPTLTPDRPDYEYDELCRGQRGILDVVAGGRTRSRSPFEEMSRNGREYFIALKERASITWRPFSNPDVSRQKYPRVIIGC